MKFYPDDYFENVEYCEYVFRKNIELELGLRNNNEIQMVANMYEKDLSSVVDRYVETGMVENDLLLINVVKEYVTTIRDHDLSELDYDDYPYEYKYAEEKAHGAHGGYGYNDSYDDLGLDEIIPEEEDKRL